MEVKKIVEGMTAVEVAEVIDSNFKNQNKILEEDIAKQNNVIGVSEYKDFSEAEAVNVGDVRKYNGYLYECVEATTGAFVASKWKKSSFKAETEKKLTELGSKVVNMESEQIDTLEEEITIQDNNGNNIIKIDSEGLDVVDLKVKGNSISKSLNLSMNTDSDDDEQVWSNDEGTEDYVKIGKYGIKAKGLFDLHGNPLLGKKVFKVSCFGDSLTYGARATDISKTSYPAVLKSLLGEDYDVLNEGISGASCQQIMARLGAQSAYLKEDVILNKTAWAYSDYELVNGEGISIGKFSQGLPDNTVNPVLINGISIYLNTNGQLCRTTNAEEDVVLRKGDAVIFNGCRRNIDSDILCLWMGTNGVYSSIEKLAEYYKNCILALGVTKYLILGMTYVDSNKNISIRKEEEDYLSSIFGVHYINLRDYLSKYSLIDANISPTESDNQLMDNGETPNSIMGIWEQGVDRIHFNDIGYRLIANQVYERGKILKYWL